MKAELKETISSKELFYTIIEGAQSTGKTTLINQFKFLFPDMTTITEVARTVIKELNITNE